MSTFSEDKSGNGIYETAKLRRILPVRRLFHATAIANLESIFHYGQLSRNILYERNIPFVELYKYDDGTVKELRDFSYCPYHLFCDTAFDYRIKQNYNNIPFLYLSWHFSKAYAENWLLIPSHAARAAKRLLFEFNNLRFSVNNMSYSLRTHALMFGKKVKPLMYKAVTREQRLYKYHCLSRFKYYKSVKAVKPHPYVENPKGFIWQGVSYE